MDNIPGCDRQLTEWLNGNPVHNGLRDECCPDFSCCYPELLWPEDRRRQFVDASEQQRNGMCMMALHALLSLAGHELVNISISGVTHGQEGDQ